VSTQPSYRHPLSESRRRGLPPIGFSLRIPERIDLTPVEGAETLLTAVERDPGGKSIAELELRIFVAAMIIDRDGTLERVVGEELERRVTPPSRLTSMRPFTLDHVSGFRGEAELIYLARGAPRPTHPYVSVLALTSHDLAARGGLLISVRTAPPEWDALGELLDSLRIFSREGANDDVTPRPTGLDLPVLGRRR
jgi:hypothetical protein